MGQTSLKIEGRFLDANFYSRPERKLKVVSAVVMHWTGNPGVGAMENWHYFNSLNQHSGAFAGAHYIVGLQGEVLRCVPESEITYHCGTNSKDPKSGRIYTDKARAMFGEPFLTQYTPNFCTLGVELCPISVTGEFTRATLQSAAALVADILTRHRLGVDRVVRHYDIVGWKECPLLWVRKPAEFEAFKQSVTEALR